MDVSSYPDTKCTGCGTTDPKHFENAVNDSLCVSCQEIEADFLADEFVEECAEANAEADETAADAN